jgi:hypothetical protein
VCILVLPDLLVHQGLREHGLIYLIVPVLPARRGGGGGQFVLHKGSGVCSTQQGHTMESDTSAWVFEHFRACDSFINSTPHSSSLTHIANPPTLAPPPTHTPIHPPRQPAPQKPMHL